MDDEVEAVWRRAIADEVKKLEIAPTLTFGEFPHCPRCDNNHADLRFRPFTHRGIVDSGGYGYTHFALCPTYLEPILLRHYNPTEREETSLGTTQEIAARAIITKDWKESE